jgi:predicted amidohydrolase
VNTLSQTTVAAIQFSSRSLNLEDNLNRISVCVNDARDRGARLIVFPELANTGYVEHDDLHRMAEDDRGATVELLKRLSLKHGVYLAAGFVERFDGHIYDALAFTSPTGVLSIYRKRHLIFWEHFYFQAGTQPLIVSTDIGRIGFAICADMMYDHVWSEYRDKIDLAVISAAWPRCTRSTAFRVGWMLRPSWSLAGEIPSRVAERLNIPVVFSNQCGPCQVRIPMMGPATSAEFAGRAGVFDHRGRRLTDEMPEEGIVIGSVLLPEEHAPCATLSA